ncbi:segregation and condensation protein A [Bifidobacterium sp.]|jgi:segregation and condensation protein A|uniref:segregation and condensation protein A n=1 Tax=Bifidobacterium sp. TaxID=41200 RepID=UPI0025C6A3A6|nr:ScpA family protein [Bifidobacterium sp.]MCI1636058.1 segregation/condensation protein A [Bifidobacterium sp.]
MNMNDEAVRNNTGLYAPSERQFSEALAPEGLSSNVPSPDTSVASEAQESGFLVTLDVYQGPFDALLGMIANKRLELTEVSLSSITEEFIAYVRQLNFEDSLDEASAFLDVAAVLIEAKSAALLPGGADGEHDEQSMEALRERDLIFARLLQYKAFKRAGDDFRARLLANAGRFPHKPENDRSFAAMLPVLQWDIDGEALAKIAAQVLANAPLTEVSVAQLHVPIVDLQQQASLVRQRLTAAKGTVMTFTALIADAQSTMEKVARFLAILAFFKQGAIHVKQAGPFEELYLRWDTDLESTQEVSMSANDFA